jgi:large subunit ribosomal protein L6
LSRIGKKPIPVPKGVEVKIQNGTISAKGPQGSLSRAIPAILKAELKDGVLHLVNVNGSPENSALWGLQRALVSNMITGCAQGFQRNLEINGVGYKAELKGKDLALTVGLSHAVVIKAPAGIVFAVDAGTKVSIKGADKELVGQYAADIRSIRPPEPYKGKGIKYAEEHIKRKAGKTAGK